MSIESDEDLAGLRKIGQLVGQTLQEMARRVRVGMTTAELDEIGLKQLAKHGARSAPHTLYGFPGTNCISVNDEAVHGIPGERVLQAGDLVKIDVTAELGGYIADAAVTVPLAPVAARQRKLYECAQKAFQQAMRVSRAGQPIFVIGRAIETEVRGQGFAVLRELSSHGVGRAIHEEPVVPNYYHPRFKQPLTEGLVITVEPIISAGSQRVREDPDGWTVRTADGSLSAHYEHTIVITRGRPIILTAA
jgi:methionyl aminopeptidase